MIRQRRLAWALVSALLTIGLAAPAMTQSVTDRTEKLTLKGRKGPKLTRPGFQVGDYTGSYSGMAASRSGFGSKDSLRAEFDIASPDWAAPVTGSCSGGQSQFTLAWITWSHETLTYNCSFSGGAPEGAGLAVAYARGRNILAKLQGNQRAGEIHWKDQVIRFETAQMSGLPLSAGKPMAYVFSKDGTEVGRLDIGGGFMAPTFYIPPKGAPERDAVMMAAISLFLFQDPGDK